MGAPVVVVFVVVVVEAVVAKAVVVEVVVSVDVGVAVRLFPSAVVVGVCLFRGCEYPGGFVVGL